MHVQTNQVIIVHTSGVYPFLKACLIINATDYIVHSVVNLSQIERVIS